jgi:hypothetical protein
MTLLLFALAISLDPKLAAASFLVFWNPNDRRLRHRHTVRDNPLFSDISVKFAGGNRYGLIGTNGST